MESAYVYFLSRRLTVIIADIESFKESFVMLTGKRRRRSRLACQLLAALICSCLGVYVSMEWLGECQQFKHYAAPY